MKKNLLLGAALLSLTSAYSQSQKLVNTDVTPMDICAAKYGLINANAGETPIVSPLKESGNIPAVLEKPVTNVSWNLLCGSMNVNGMLVSHSRPLQYNPELNAVTFIHRKSATYVTSPVLNSLAQPGIIVAEVSTNWGSSFDSTAIWLDNNQWGRYPQGAIYNPATNTNLAQAYIVGSGPTVSGSNFTGNFYTSKQLNTFNNSPSTAAGSQQFFSFSLSSYPPELAPHGWGRDGFTATDDGLVRSLGIVEGDFQKLASVRAFAVTTGSFNGTSFD